MPTRFPLLLLLALLPACSAPPRITIDPDTRSFTRAGEPFTPWGFNYDHDADGRLIEDYWHDEWAAVARGLKTIDDGLEVRERFLLSFEAAEREPDLLQRRAILTFVVIGGGPTGVEALAATMNLPSDTLSDEIEPYLLREQFIVRSPRGRIATQRAFQLLGKPMPKPKSDEPQTPGLFD